MALPAIYELSYKPEGGTENKFLLGTSVGGGLNFYLYNNLNDATTTLNLTAKSINLLHADSNNYGVNINTDLSAVFDSISLGCNKVLCLSAGNGVVLKTSGTRKAYLDAKNDTTGDNLHIGKSSKAVYIGESKDSGCEGRLYIDNENTTNSGVYVNATPSVNTPQWRRVATEDDIAAISTTFSPAREAWITGGVGNPILELPSTGWYFVEYIETDETGGTTRTPVGILRASTAYRNILLFKASFYDTDQGCYWFRDYMLTTTQDDKPKMKLFTVGNYNSNGTITSVQTASSDKIRVKLIAPDTTN